LETCKRDETINNPGIVRMVKNYFFELSLLILAGAKVLKKGAPFIMVNDNVRYEGAHVPVDLILSDFAEQAGLNVEAIWVLPRGKGNSSQQMGLHGRQEVRKCVYIWRKR
jgi:Tfp pilus assembly protein PilZ